MSSDSFQQGLASSSFGELWSQAVQSFTRADSEKLATERGYSAGTCEWLRALSLIGRFENGIAFPINDESGSVCGLHCRLSDRRSWKVLGGPMQPLVIGRPNAHSDVFVFASQWDAFAIADKLCLFRPWCASPALIITRGYENGGLVAGLCGPNTLLYAFVTNRSRKLNRKPVAKHWLRSVCAGAACQVLRVAVPISWEDFNGWTQDGRATAQELREAITNAKRAN